MNSVVPQYPRPGGGSQTVAYTASSASSGALPQGVQSITFYCSTAAYVKVMWHATAATATATDFPVPANVLVTIPVPQRGANDAAGADKLFVAAIRAAADGSLFVQPNAD